MRIQDFEWGGREAGAIGSDKKFTSGIGYGGHAPSCDSKGVWGSDHSSPSRFFAFAIILHENHTFDAVVLTAQQLNS